jgi:hypothetical protein
MVKLSTMREIFLFLTVSYVVAVILSSDHEDKVDEHLRASHLADQGEFSADQGELKPRYVTG